MSEADSRSASKPDDQADGRWMTFRELAALRGISKLSAATLVRRHGWRRQRDNQGRVIALVPLTWTRTENGPPPDSKTDNEANNKSDNNGLQAAVAVLREQQEHERRALKGQIDALRAVIEAKDGELAAYRGQIDGFEARVAALQTERDRALADLQVALLARSEAEADVAELRQAETARKARGRWARLRAAWRRE